MAFTLVELLCVLTLLGLIVAIAAPAVGTTMDKYELEAAVRNLAMDMRKSQQKAITSGNVQRIEFRTSVADYRLKDAVTGEQVTVKLPDGINYSAVNFPRDSSGYPVLYFTRSGAPNRGGTVSLVDRHGRELHVIITPATGRVRVSESLAL
jgi:prepilin-type N-terminal cleavage/methylation domain-containing protein